jgi:hypothetical protein
MTAEHQNLWTKIKCFQFDKHDSEFSFSDRVARENGWTKNYTARVIDEYKKFIFLCCISNEAITPSDPVDQVWHLHLTYTKSYWLDFCKDTLGKDIHHNPTKGGLSEAKKFDEYYTRIKILYKTYFNSEPPNDIWQTNKQRFTDIGFQRVNLNDYWLIKRPARIFLRKLAAIFVIAIGLISINATSDYIGIIAFIFIVVGIVALFPKSKENSDSSSGCSIGGGSSDLGHHSSDSGCSGCSSSGCSGCGGGGGD